MKLHRKLSEAPPAAAAIEAIEPTAIEWQARVVGAERIRALLGGDHIAGPREPQADLGDAACRWFEVRQVVLGRGLWVVEMLPTGRRSAVLWVEDPEASQYFEAGNLFGARMRPNDRIAIPRFWDGCEECRRNMRRA